MYTVLDRLIYCIFILIKYRVDELVKIAYDKAFHISCDILSIPAHKKPSFLNQPFLHSAGDMVAQMTEDDDESDWESDEEVEEDSNDSASESESEHFAPVLALIDDADPSTSLSLLEECDILVSSFTR